MKGFIDVFSRRIAVFDKVAVVGVNKPVDVATLPENDEFAARARPTSPSAAAVEWPALRMGAITVGVRVPLAG